MTTAIEEPVIPKECQALKPTKDSEWEMLKLRLMVNPETTADSIELAIAIRKNGQPYETGQQKKDKYWQMARDFVKEASNAVQDYGTAWYAKNVYNPTIRYLRFHKLSRLHEAVIVNRWSDIKNGKPVVVGGIKMLMPDGREIVGLENLPEKTQKIIEARAKTTETPDNPSPNRVFPLKADKAKRYGKKTEPPAKASITRKPKPAKASVGDKLDELNKLLGKPKEK